MGVKGWAMTVGISAAVGAVGILMMSRNNPTRKLATEAADKMESVAMKISDKMSQKNWL